MMPEFQDVRYTPTGNRLGPCARALRPHSRTALLLDTPMEVRDGYVWASETGQTHDHHS